jgi:hypothetical protein
MPIKLSSSQEACFNPTLIENIRKLINPKQTSNLKKLEVFDLISYWKKPIKRC